MINSGGRAIGWGGGRNERGSIGTILTITSTMVLACLFFVACVLGGWFASARQAERVAELAALAAVSASVSGQEPCAAAGLAAHHNKTEVARCAVQGQGRYVVVEIEVAAELQPRLWAGPQRVSRSATAGT